MPRESSAGKKNRAKEIIRRLARAYPGARCWLDYETPFQLFVATVLSAQCTDERVNAVTPGLFRKYKGPSDYVNAPAGELERDIRPTGFFNNKAKSLRRAGAVLMKEFGGRLPEAEEDLLRLPGVGRKTANVIRGNAFGAEAGMVVDTHVGRLSRRLGLTRETDPVKVETELNRLVPVKDRAVLAHRLIQHGRLVCTARRAFCDRCVLADLCPKVGVSVVPREKRPKAAARGRRT
ncbi:MAG TPA: endonuclease III [Thermoanaerobaculia bacterium]|nr:endonuclease III [Thermoanaerobaculia bacterium]